MQAHNIPGKTRQEQIAALSPLGRLLPLKPQTKEPGWNDWPKKAGQPHVWADTDNVGVVPHNGFLVVDVDIKNAGKGLELLARLEQKCGPIPREAVVRTPSKGLHIWLRTPPTLVGFLASQAKAFGGFFSETAGLEFFGGETKHFVCAPPSHYVHRDSKTGEIIQEKTGPYVWEVGGPETVPEAPESLVEFLAAALATKPKPTSGGSSSSPLVGLPAHGGERERRYVQAAVEGACAAVAATAEGTRNATLNNAGCALGNLVGAGRLSRAEAERALMLAAQACGLDDGGAAASIRSGLDKGEKDPRWPDPVSSLVGQLRSAKEVKTAWYRQTIKEALTPCWSQLTAEQQTDAKEDLVRALRAKKIGQPKEYLEGIITAIEVPEVANQDEPWPDPVVGSELFLELKAYFDEHAVLPKGASTALALWVVHTHLFDIFDYTPRIIITSPDKRCGKSRLLELIEEVVREPLQASFATAAVIYRKIERCKATIMIDEIDRFDRVKLQEIIGILNQGFRFGRTIPRCVVTPDEITERDFDVFSPAIVAGIDAVGKTSDTLVDRSIVIRMTRKENGQPVAPFGRDQLAETKALKRRIIRWCVDARGEVQAQRPTPLVGAGDREQDIWYPLQAIAAAMLPTSGGEECAHSFRTLKESRPEESEFEALLTDIKDIVDDRNGQSIEVAELVRLLTQQLGNRWNEAHHGRPITEKWLGRKLRAAGVISDRSPTRNGYTKRAYRTADLQAAIAAYIPSGEE